MRMPLTQTKKILLIGGRCSFLGFFVCFLFLFFWSLIAVRGGLLARDEEERETGDKGAKWCFHGSLEYLLTKRASPKPAGGGGGDMVEKPNRHVPAIREANVPKHSC